MTQVLAELSRQRKFEPKATASLLSLYSRMREVPKAVLETRFFEERAALEYFRKSCEACEELLTLYQMGLSDSEKLREEVGRIKADVESLRQPKRDVAGDLSALLGYQEAVIHRLAGILKGIPDGTFLVISYEGKILGRAESTRELSLVLGGLTVPRSQVFTHLKGSDAAFRWG